jgi:hypothetical protein
MKNQKSTKFKDVKCLTGWATDNLQGRASMDSQGAYPDSKEVPEGFAPCGHQIPRTGVEYAAVMTSSTKGHIGRCAQAYYSLWAKTGDK